MVLALIVNLDREQDAPVTGAQPHSGSTYERFHIADAGFKRMPLQFEVDLRARSRRKFTPLADGGWRMAADVTRSLSSTHYRIMRFANQV